MEDSTKPATQRQKPPQTQAQRDAEFNQFVQGLKDMQKGYRPEGRERGYDAPIGPVPPSDPVRAALIGGMKNPKAYGGRKAKPILRAASKKIGFRPPAPTFTYDIKLEDGRKVSFETSAKLSDDEIADYTDEALAMGVRKNKIAALPFDVTELEKANREGFSVIPIKDNVRAAEYHRLFGQPGTAFTPGQLDVAAASRAYQDAYGSEMSGYGKVSEEELRNREESAAQPRLTAGRDGRLARSGNTRLGDVGGSIVGGAMNFGADLVGLGELVGIPGAQGIRKGIQKSAQGMVSGKDYSKDPVQDWAMKLGSGVGSVLPALLPGLGVASLAAKGGRLANVAGALTETALSAGSVAGGNYTDAIDSGMDRGEAIARALGERALLTPVEGYLNRRLGIFGGARNPLLRVGGEALSEGAEELSQSVGGDIVSKRPVDWRKALESGVLGSIVGGGMGTIASGPVTEGPARARLPRNPRTRIPNATSSGGVVTKAKPAPTVVQDKLVFNRTERSNPPAWEPGEQDRTLGYFTPEERALQLQTLPFPDRVANAQPEIDAIRGRNSWDGTTEPTQDDIAHQEWMLKRAKRDLDLYSQSADRYRQWIAEAESGRPDAFPLPDAKAGLERDLAAMAEAQNRIASTSAKLEGARTLVSKAAGQGLQRSSQDETVLLAAAPVLERAKDLVASLGAIQGTYGSATDSSMPVILGRASGDGPGFAPYPASGEIGGVRPSEVATGTKEEVGRDARLQAYALGANPTLAQDAPQTVRDLRALLAALGVDADQSFGRDQARRAGPVAERILDTYRAVVDSPITSLFVQKDGKQVLPAQRQAVSATGSAPVATGAGRGTGQVRIEDAPYFNRSRPEGPSSGQRVAAVRQAITEDGGNPDAPEFAPFIQIAQQEDARAQSPSGAVMGMETPTGTQSRQEGNVAPGMGNSQPVPQGKQAVIDAMRQGFADGKLFGGKQKVLDAAVAFVESLPDEALKDVGLSVDSWQDGGITAIYQSGFIRVLEDAISMDPEGAVYAIAHEMGHHIYRRLDAATVRALADQFRGELNSGDFDAVQRFANYPELAGKSPAEIMGDQDLMSLAFDEWFAHTFAVRGLDKLTPRQLPVWQAVSKKVSDLWTAFVDALKRGGRGDVAARLVSKLDKVRWNEGNGNLADAPRYNIEPNDLALRDEYIDVTQRANAPDAGADLDAEFGRVYRRIAARAREVMIPGKEMTIGENPITVISTDRDTVTYSIGGRERKGSLIDIWMNTLSSAPAPAEVPAETPAQVPTEAPAAPSPAQTETATQSLKPEDWALRDSYRSNDPNAKAAAIEAINARASELFAPGSRHALYGNMWVTAKEVTPDAVVFEDSLGRDFKVEPPAEAFAALIEGPGRIPRPVGQGASSVDPLTAPEPTKETAPEPAPQAPEKRKPRTAAGIIEQEAREIVESGADFDTEIEARYPERFSDEQKQTLRLAVASDGTVDPFPSHKVSDAIRAQNEMRDRYEQSSVSRVDTFKAGQEIRANDPQAPYRLADQGKGGAALNSAEQAAIALELEHVERMLEAGHEVFMEAVDSRDSERIDRARMYQEALRLDRENLLTGLDQSRSEAGRALALGRAIQGVNNAEDVIREAEGARGERLVGEDVTRAVVLGHKIQEAELGTSVQETLEEMDRRKEKVKKASKKLRKASPESDEDSSEDGPVFDLFELYRAELGRIVAEINAGKTQRVSDSVVSATPAPPKTQYGVLSPFRLKLLAMRYQAIRTELEKGRWMGDGTFTGAKSPEELYGSRNLGDTPTPKEANPPGGRIGIEEGPADPFVSATREMYDKARKDIEAAKEVAGIQLRINAFIDVSWIRQALATSEPGTPEYVEAEMARADIHRRAGEGDPDASVAVAFLPLDSAPKPLLSAEAEVLQSRLSRLMRMTGQRNSLLNQLRRYSDAIGFMAQGSNPFPEESAPAETFAENEPLARAVAKQRQLRDLYRRLNDAEMDVERMQATGLPPKTEPKPEAILPGNEAVAQRLTEAEEGRQAVRDRLNERSRIVDAILLLERDIMTLESGGDLAPATPTARTVDPTNKGLDGERQMLRDQLTRLKKIRDLVAEQASTEARLDSGNYRPAEPRSTDTGDPEIDVLRQEVAALKRAERLSRELEDLVYELDMGSYVAPDPRMRAIDSPRLRDIRQKLANARRSARDFIDAQRPMGVIEFLRSTTRALQFTNPLARVGDAASAAVVIANERLLGGPLDPLIERILFPRAKDNEVSGLTGGNGYVSDFAAAIVNIADDIKGFLSIRDNLKAVGSTLTNGGAEFDSKYGRGRVRLERSFKNEALKKIAASVDAALNVAMRTVGVTDAVVRQSLQAGAVRRFVAAYAQRRARVEGISFSEAVKQIQADEGLMDQVHAAAGREIDHILFADPGSVSDVLAGLWSPRTAVAAAKSTGLSDASAANVGQGVVFALETFVTRYPRIFGRMISMAVDNSPIGVGKGFILLATSGTQDVPPAMRKQVVQTIRRGMTGTAFYAIAAHIAKALGEDWLEKFGEYEPVSRTIKWKFPKQFEAFLQAESVAGPFSAVLLPLTDIRVDMLLKKGLIEEDQADTMKLQSKIKILGNAPIVSGGERLFTVLNGRRPVQKFLAASLADNLSIGAQRGYARLKDELSNGVDRRITTAPDGSFVESFKREYMANTPGYREQLPLAEPGVWFDLTPTEQKEFKRLNYSPEPVKADRDQGISSSEAKKIAAFQRTEMPVFFREAFAGPAYKSLPDTDPSAEKPGDPDIRSKEEALKKANELGRKAAMLNRQIPLTQSDIENFAKVGIVPDPKYLTDRDISPEERTRRVEMLKGLIKNDFPKVVELTKVKEGGQEAASAWLRKRLRIDKEVNYSDADLDRLVEGKLINGKKASKVKPLFGDLLLAAPPKAP